MALPIQSRKPALRLHLIDTNGRVTLLSPRVDLSKLDVLNRYRRLDCFRADEARSVPRARAETVPQQANIASRRHGEAERDPLRVSEISPFLAVLRHSQGQECRAEPSWSCI